MTSEKQTALITGANSGLGFETAAQLAEAGWEKIFLACRTVEKAADARRRLIERTARDPFAELAIDTAEIESAAAAATELSRLGNSLDFVVLNAGWWGTDQSTNSAGVDLIYASTLIGHHVLTVKLVEAGLLAAGARLVASSSDVVRADVSGAGITKTDFHALASRKKIELSELLVRSATGRIDHENSDYNQAYYRAKSILTWWVGALARRLPAGLGVYAVAPGATPDTRFFRRMPFWYRSLLMPVLGLLGPRIGMAHSVADGAGRYLKALHFPIKESGSFYASPPEKLTGPLEKVTLPEVRDEALHEAAWQALVELTGVVYEMS